MDVDELVFESDDARYGSVRPIAVAIRKDIARIDAGSLECIIARPGVVKAARYVIRHAFPVHLIELKGQNFVQSSQAYLSSFRSPFS